MRSVRTLKATFLALVSVVLSSQVRAQKALPDATSELAGKIDKQMEREQKKRAAVIAFRELGGQPTVFGTYLAESLVTDLVAFGNLDLVERSTLDKVMGELKLNASGAIDPATAKQVGKLVGADAVITGTITDFQSYVAVNCRLIETQTGRIFAAAETRIVKDDDVKKVMNVPIVNGSVRDNSARGSASVPTGSAPGTSFSVETKRTGPLEVRFLGCRPKGLGLYCGAMVTNLQEERQYCLYSVDGDVMSRLVDEQGLVYKAEEIDLGAKHLQNMVIACTILVKGIPVQAGLFYPKGPQNGQLALVEFRFDLDRSYAGQTSFKAEFRGVPVLH